MQKDGYQEVYQGRTSRKVATNSDGYIAMTGDTSTGNKTFSITFANADNSRTQNELIFDTIATIIGGATTPMLVNGTPTQTINFTEYAEE